MSVLNTLSIEFRSRRLLIVEALRSPHSSNTELISNRKTLNDLSYLFLVLSYVAEPFAKSFMSGTKRASGFMISIMAAISSEETSSRLRLKGANYSKQIEERLLYPSYDLDKSWGNRQKSLYYNLKK